MMWFLSPIGRWFSGVFALIAFMISVYVRGRKDAQNSKLKEAERKLRDAVEADLRARERIARGELLANDGFKRD